MNNFGTQPTNSLNSGLSVVLLRGAGSQSAGSGSCIASAIQGSQHSLDLPGLLFSVKEEVAAAVNVMDATVSTPHYTQGSNSMACQPNN